MADEGGNNNEPMARKNEERLRELKDGDDEKSKKAEELEAYKNTETLPDNVSPNQVKVDMASECVILPIYGNPVPFHISTIKDVVLVANLENAHLKIKFYTDNLPVGKYCPANTAQLVQKYTPYATFIKEMTFRMSDNHSLTTAFHQISELHKRARAKELQGDSEEEYNGLMLERIQDVEDISISESDGGDSSSCLENYVFVYTGDYNIQVPREVTHVIVQSFDGSIGYGAFNDCQNLVSIEMHDGVDTIQFEAFYCCRSLRSINLSGVREIETEAFYGCEALADVGYCDELETIGCNAFQGNSLRHIVLPKVRVIEDGAFKGCQQLTEVEFSEDLERIGEGGFLYCRRLRRVTIPLKVDMLTMYGGGVFYGCDDLSQVNLVGEIHETISSLLLDRWRNEMNDEINSINRDLPNINHDEKTEFIQEWMERVLEKIEHYKLKEFTTLLELALWKAKLDESQDEWSFGRDRPAKIAKIDMKAECDRRQEQRIACGANVVIKNVLPFLKVE